MKIEVTPEQNILVDGVEYLAKPSNSCTGCVLEDGIGCLFRHVPCAPHERKDDSCVIFVKPEVAA